MQINSNVLTLDIKVQDKFRELLANRDADFPKLVGVVLGDSDIDYSLLDQSQAKILNAPFNVNKVKFPLIYQGATNGLEGNITCFARKIVAGSPTVTSLYSYPPTVTFTPGIVPPNINNGLDWNILPFDTAKQGYILFFQTLMLNYFNPDTNQQYRLNEPMKIEVTFSGSTIVPANWEVTIDDTTSPIVHGVETINVHHNSMMISRDVSGTSTVGLNTNGKIKVTGLLSNITKTIAFNI